MPADITEAIDTARAIKSVAYDAGYQSGYEAGLRAAQTQIDAAAAEHGRTEERARVAALLGPRLRNAVDVAVLDGEELWCVELRAAFTEYEAAIRSGEPAPEAT